MNKNIIIRLENKEDYRKRSLGTMAGTESEPQLFAGSGELQQYQYQGY